MSDRAAATLILTTGVEVTVVRTETGVWDGLARCPIAGCTEPAIHVRAYEEHAVVEGRAETGRWAIAPAWCRGRHDAPVGTLRVRLIETEQLIPMGVGEPETFRCRIY